MQTLLGSAARDWARFDGWSASRLPGSKGPLGLPLDRLCNLVYFYFVGEADKDQRERFDARLWMPPKGTAPAEGSVWSAENETLAFAAFAAEVGVEVPKAVAAPDAR